MTDETNADLVEMLRIIVPCTDKQAAKFFASSLALSVTPDHLIAVLAWANARQDAAIDEAIKTCVELNRALSDSRTLVGDLTEALEKIDAEAQRHRLLRGMTALPGSEADRSYGTGFIVDTARAALAAVKETPTNV